MTNRKVWLIALGVIVCIVLVLRYFVVLPGQQNGLLIGNGRVEATEIDVAAKIAGRIRDILVKEGDFVTAGQIVAIMDTENLEAQLRQAEAELLQARTSVAVARSQVVQRQAEREAAVAQVAQRQAEFNVARKRHVRSTELAQRSAVSQQEVDDDFARQQSAAAAVAAAEAQVAAADAAIATANSQIVGAESTVAAAQASIERIQADINDSELRAVRDGRVQYRIAQPGEVVASGGRILNLVDLSDVYMTFFLPTRAAGRLAVGTEVRLVLDAAPEYVFPAQVSFVADVAQFTPKTVETASEREKLMFRVRAQVAPDVLDENILRVKTGLPGVAYLLADADQTWPEALAVKVP